MTTASAMKELKALDITKTNPSIESIITEIGSEIGS